MPASTGPKTHRNDESYMATISSSEKKRMLDNTNITGRSKEVDKPRLTERLDGGNSAKPSRDASSKLPASSLSFAKLDEDMTATFALASEGGIRSSIKNRISLKHTPAATSLEERVLEAGNQSSEAKDVDTGKRLDNPNAAINGSINKERISRLSPDKLVELIYAPDALPLQMSPSFESRSTLREDNDLGPLDGASIVSQVVNGVQACDEASTVLSPFEDSMLKSPDSVGVVSERSSINSRAVSTPMMKRKQSNNRAHGITPISIPPAKSGRQPSSQLNTRDLRPDVRGLRPDDLIPSPLPQSFPIPPLSVPTHLHLELSSSRPSPLYIYRPSTSEFPYEPSHVKLERLLNFLLLPPQLEQVVCFGALACFDAWLYTFTILPLRFLKALSILFQSWLRNAWAEVLYIAHFIYMGIGRVWTRMRAIEPNITTEDPKANGVAVQSNRSMYQHTSSIPGHVLDAQAHATQPVDNLPQREAPRKRMDYKHRRTRSGPSNLLPVDKADILKGFLILISCYMLMYFDASMMYHNIRGQAAIKLYVIYNALEVFDRLLSAFGQDVLECLFAKETLERKPNGRSKILRPFSLFLLALAYNIIHSLCLYYQVITLNVAVNSYSNALLTLLMSNQFVEIKSTVLKKIEKENLFQMTCADIVERFQLWLMLIIIASRNIVETGGLAGASSATSSTPDRSSSLLPHSFTLLPDWTGQVMGPFFLVLGTEMLVDWAKHAFITKFNNTKPNIYGRFLDVLAKDFYTNAFSDPNLTRRVGLATIPLSCLFIRASVQTYHMFLATHTLPTPPTTTSLTDESFPSPETTPAITAAIQHIDRLFKRTIFGAEAGEAGPAIDIPWMHWLTLHLPSSDTILNYSTKALFFAIFFLVLLILKILLGMILLSFARARYAGMKKREQDSSAAEGKRLGAWGVTELGDDKRRWIYEDDAEGLRRMRERDKDTREKEEKGGGRSLGSVERYAMVAKRIW